MTDTYRKTTSVIFDQTKCISGGASNDCFFYIDWNAILKPNMSYYVTFTYISYGTNVYAGYYPPMLWADIGVNTMIDGGNDFILGIIKPLVEHPAALNNIILYADADSNTPSYIANRPNGNIVHFRVIGSDRLNWIDDAANPSNPAAWRVTLHFTEADKLPPIKKLYLSYYQAEATFNNVNMNYLLDKSKRYKVSFVFSGGKPVTSAYVNSLVNINWNMDTAYPFSNLTYASEYGILGKLGRIRYDTGITGAYIDTNALTNEPVTLVQWNTNIIVRFLGPDLNLSPYFPDVPNRWALLLSFTEIN